MPLMNSGAATLAVVGAVWLGAYGFKWRNAERERQAAAARVAAAGKAAWSARRVMAVVGAFVFVLIWLWIHGRGRG